MSKLPMARTTGVVVQTLGKEVLIYDLNSNKAFNLNETSAVVYQACDGKTSVDELRVKTKFTDDIIFLAIDELKRENLIEADDSLVSPFAGVSRREVIRKVGLGTMVALPLISSLVAPTAAMAQSGAAAGAANCQTCTTGTDCASGRCLNAFPADGTRICSSGTGSGGFTGKSGASFAAVDTASCSGAASIQCCSGSGTFSAPSTCTCT